MLLRFVLASPFILYYFILLYRFIALMIFLYEKYDIKIDVLMNSKTIFKRFPELKYKKNQLYKWSVHSILCIIIVFIIIFIL
jgi:hypothetical protein